MVALDIGRVRGDSVRNTEVDELELGISMLADQEMGIGRRAVRADVYRRPTRRVDVLSQDVVLFPEAAITGTTSPND